MTDNDGAAKVVIKHVVLAPKAAAFDTFERTATRWGTADRGGAWTVSGGTFSTDGDSGDVKLATPGASAAASLGAVSQRDVDLVADISAEPAGTRTGISSSLLARQQGSSDYRLTLRELSKGAIRLTLARTASGVTTPLRAVKLTGLTRKRGGVIRLRFTVTGSGTATLTGKAWRSGNAEPNAAQITATDARAELQSAGAVGFSTHLDASVTALPVTIGVDNLVLTQ